jgi:amino acid transporter
MPRALLAALFIVITFYVLVAVAAVGTQPWQVFEGQSEAGLARILENVTGTPIWGTILALGAVISIFSVTLVTLYGQTRILFAMGRDGMLPHLFSRVNPRTQTPVNNTIIVAIVVAILAAIVPLDYLIDVVSIGTLTAFIVVSLGVIILRYREPDLPRGFKVPGFPVTPILSILACAYILISLHWYTWVIFIGWVAVFLVFYMLYGRRHSVLGQERGEEPVVEEK